MLVLIRHRLLAGDFASNLKLLQRYPTKEICVQRVIRVAERLITPIGADFVGAVATIAAAPLTGDSTHDAQRGYGDLGTGGYDGGYGGGALDGKKMATASTPDVWPS